MSNNDIDLDAIEAEYKAIDWYGHPSPSAWAKKHGDALLALTRTLAARVAELEAVVAKLPKTADGVPVVPGASTDLWHIAQRTANGIQAGDAEHNINWNGWGARFFSDLDDEYWPSRDPSNCYSTRAAALAATNPTTKETGRE